MEPPDPGQPPALPQAEPTAARRPLGIVSATALVVANMIGTGVFTTSGFLLANLGSRAAVLAAWLAGGIVAALGASSYGALGRRFPESGGEYLFLSRTLHPAAGWVAGWISLLVGFSAPLAAATFAFGAYAVPWLPGWSPRVSGTMLLVAFSLVHGAHVERGAWIQNGTVAVKVAAIVLFLGVAAARLALPAVQPIALPSVPAFAVALVWVAYSYSGWNAAVYVAGEIQDAERTLPRALLLGTAVVTLLYVALNAVFLCAAPPEAIAGKLEVGRIAAEALGGPSLAAAMSALVALVLVSSISSMIMTGPRVYARMASDGCLPRWLAAEAGPPRAAIALQAGVALVMLWSATYEGLLTYIGFTLGLSTAATVLGLVLLRRREGAGFPVRGWPWVPGTFLAAIVCMTSFSMLQRPAASALGLATVAGGLLLWRIGYGRPASHSTV